VITSTNGIPLFDVATNLTLRGLSLVNGRSSSTGGALYIRPNVVVIANGCVFGGNTATGTNGMAGVSGTTNSNNIGDDGGAGAPGVSGLGGAIYNLGSLALVNCMLTNNAATGGVGGAGGNGGVGSGTFEVGGDGGSGGAGGLGQGGAVYNLGDLTLIDCSFWGNSAVGGAGGAGGTGGSGTNPGLTGNGGGGGYGAGGAVFNGRNLTVRASTFTTNSAVGGASANAGSNANGSGKEGTKGGPGSGGAIYNGWWMAITNSTFFTNFVIGGTAGNGGPGGGTFGLQGEGGDGGDGTGGSLNNANTVTIVNCTFSSGGAFGGTNGVAGGGSFTNIDNGELGAAQGGNIASSGPILVLMNSILTAAASGGNLSGSFTDAGNNLSSDLSGSPGLQNRNPLLGPLAANGGPTLTMALLTNSPAIDRIDPAQAPPTDQRGVARPVNNFSDIGAFEFGVSVTISNVTLRIGETTNGQFVLASGGATPGVAYLVQASTNVSSGWQTISTNTASSNGLITYIDTATNFSSRYYRITR
jgi:hypothetical protein